MVIDSSKCFNCKACIVACQLQNGVPAGRNRNWIKQGFSIVNNRLHFQPGNCMHCDLPTCVAACPTGATFKNALDGTVAVDQELCIGCGSCVPACPYGARFLHPIVGSVDKCDYCTERRNAGLDPACVEVCPTQARVFGDLLDETSQVSRLLSQETTVRVIDTITNTEPAIFYISHTAPMDWTTPAVLPTPIRFWKECAGTLVKAVVGFSAFSVIIMLGKQLLTKEELPN